MDSTTSQRAATPPGLTRAPSRRLALEAWGLAARTGFVMRGGADGAPRELVAEDRIVGEARLTRDRLGRVGALDEADRIPLTIHPMPEGASEQMLLGLGHGGDSEGFHAALWLPQGAFAALAQDTAAGRIERLTLAATTNLWIAASERGAPAEAGVTWLIGPAEAGASPGARGLVERIVWNAPPPVMPAVDEPAPGAPDAAPAIPEDEVEPPETVAEMLGRLNWSLKQIALVLVFLLIVVALK